MHRTSLLLLGALLVGCPSRQPAAPRPSAAAETLPPPPQPREDGRLPQTAIPRHYDLAFDVDPRSPRFSGSVRIDVELPAPTAHVVLHGRDIDVTTARATAGGRSVAATAKHRATPGAKAPEEIVLSFGEILRGAVTLEIAWTAPFGDSLAGLYRVSDGGRDYAFTQFEATDARRAFPCFDEPMFKTPFDVRVTTPKDELAVSNSPEIAREAAGAKTTYRFATTTPLPTYLVALAVGALEVKEAARTKPTIRVITTKGKLALGELALASAGKYLDGLADWLGVPYPYAKLDVVAVPDFAAGAMENAGFVTFREEYLLFDTARASLVARRRLDGIMAHELAHQWFGDLVTASWWEDTWLNEGMATWMETRILDRLEPKYGEGLDLVATALDVMDVDALASARAVRQPVTSTSEAEEAFDGLTYEKGAAVLSTIERWLGEETFRRGLHAYLEANADKSVSSGALFAALDRSSGRDVTPMAASFLDRPGVPEVTAHVVCDPSGRWYSELSQEPWRPLGSQVKEDLSQVWTIPVCVRAQGEKKDQCIDLSAGAPSIAAGRGACPGFLHPNPSAEYYRFVVDDKEFVRMAQARDLDAPARVEVVANAWAAVRSGKLKAEVLLKMLPSFDDDASRHVTGQVLDVITGMDEIVFDEEARPAFKRFVAARLAKKKKALGWTQAKDRPDDATLRQQVLVTLADVAEDEATLREAEEQTTRWLADPAAIDADIAAFAVDLASRHAGASRLGELREAAKRAKDQEDRLVAIRAMMGFDDPTTLRAALDLTLTDEVRPNDMRHVMNAAFGRKRSRVVAEAWVRGHWDQLRKKLPGALATMLTRAAGVACLKEEVAERAAFYKPRFADVEGAERPLAQALERGGLCAELRVTAGPNLTRALTKK